MRIFASSSSLVMIFPSPDLGDLAKDIKRGESKPLRISCFILCVWIHMCTAFLSVVHKLVPSVHVVLTLLPMCQFALAVPLVELACGWPYCTYGIVALTQCTMQQPHFIQAMISD